MIDCHPAFEPGIPRIVKVHHRDVTIRGKVRVGSRESQFEPWIEHGEGVGEENDVKLTTSMDHWGMIGPVQQLHPRAERQHLLASDAQHFRRKINPCNLSIGKAPAKIDQVPPGTAPDF